MKATRKSSISETATLRDGIRFLNGELLSASFLRIIDTGEETSAPVGVYPTQSPELRDAAAFNLAYTKDSNLVAVQFRRKVAPSALSNQISRGFREIEKEAIIRCHFKDDWGQMKSFKLTFLRKYAYEGSISHYPTLSVRSIRDPAMWQHVERLISTGNVTELQRMLAAGEISHLDHGPDGKNLLHVCTLE